MGSPNGSPSSCGHLPWGHGLGPADLPLLLWQSALGPWPPLVGRHRLRAGIGQHKKKKEVIFKYIF